MRMVEAYRKGDFKQPDGRKAARPEDRGFHPGKASNQSEAEALKVRSPSLHLARNEIPVFPRDPC
jgi:hypothetical protein